jgi:hypothetical protein
MSTCFARSATVMPPRVRLMHKTRSLRQAQLDLVAVRLGDIRRLARHPLPQLFAGQPSWINR